MTHTNKNLLVDVSSTSQPAQLWLRSNDNHTVCIDLGVGTACNAGESLSDAHLVPGCLIPLLKVPAAAGAPALTAHSCASNSAKKRQLARPAAVG